jgi:transcriptional regulator with XRE-family HTH domain
MAHPSSAHFKQQLGERLRSARTALGETQTKFAARMGVTKLSVLKYEAGAWCPTVEQLHGLKASGIDPSFIAFGESNVSEHPLSDPITRKHFAAIFAKVYKESLTLTPDATEEDLIEVAWAVFSSEDQPDADDLLYKVRLALSNLAP